MFARTQSRRCDRVLSIASLLSALPSNAYLDLRRSLGCYEAAGRDLDQQFKGGAMRYISHWLSSGVMISLGFLAGAQDDTRAADLGPPPPAPLIEAPAVPGWTVRFTPYGWLTSLNGTQTVRGRSVKVDASFIDIVEKSDTKDGASIGRHERHSPSKQNGEQIERDRPSRIL